MAERLRSLARHRNYALLREYKATMIDRERLGRLGAHSVGIGRKEAGGKRTNTLALLFYLSRKRSVAQLSGRQRIPASVTFFSRIANRQVRLPTDVIETPPPTFNQDPTGRFRPAPGGVSFGIAGITGTLGGWVWDPTDDTLVALSNNHILGNTLGTNTLQPGSRDDGSSPADKLGDVKRTIPLRTDRTNTVDCAISDVDRGQSVDIKVLEIGFGVFAAVTPIIDMEVEKFGRTNGHTFGQITDVDLETTLEDTFEMDDCLRIVPVSPTTNWSADGDSGAVVFSRTPVRGDIKPAVGLHFGESGVNGSACKIQNVFAALDVEPICQGFFPSFAESMFEREEEIADRPELETQTARGLPRPVTRRERERPRARRFHAGIARDLQARLAATKRGRLLTDFVDEHSAELAQLLIKDGDVRRAAIAAVRPLVAGAATTTDVLERTLTPADLQRLGAFARELSRRGSKDIKRGLGPVVALGSAAKGKTPAKVLSIRP